MCALIATKQHTISAKHAGKVQSAAAVVPTLSALTPKLVDPQATSSKTGARLACCMRAPLGPHTKSAGDLIYPYSQSQLLEEEAECPTVQNAKKKYRLTRNSAANCGAVLQTTTQAAPTPTSAYTPPSPLGDLGSRIVAGLVDYVIIGIITGILALLLFLPAWLVTGRWFSGFFGILGVMWLLWLIYFTYFEGTSGQTIGKKFTHIKVIKEDGSKCDFGPALVRNVLRIVDHLPFLYILGIILIAATDKRQRLGDMLGKTIVVKA